MPNSVSAPNEHEQAKTKRTCEQCASSKIKCSGTSPCERCVARNLDCTYLARRPRVLTKPYYTKRKKRTDPNAKCICGMKMCAGRCVNHSSIVTSLGHAQLVLHSCDRAATRLLSPLVIDRFAFSSNTSARESFAWALLSTVVKQHGGRDSHGPLLHIFRRDVRALQAHFSALCLANSPSSSQENSIQALSFQSEKSVDKSLNMMSPYYPTLTKLNNMLHALNIDLDYFFVKRRQHMEEVHANRIDIDDQMREDFFEFKTNEKMIEQILSEIAVSEFASDHNRHDYKNDRHTIMINDEDRPIEHFHSYDDHNDHTSHSENSHGPHRHHHLHNHGSSHHHGHNLTHHDHQGHNSHDGHHVTKGHLEEKEHKDVEARLNKDSEKNIKEVRRKESRANDDKIFEFIKATALQDHKKAGAKDSSLSLKFNFLLVCGSMIEQIQRNLYFVDGFINKNAAVVVLQDIVPNLYEAKQRQMNVQCNPTFELLFGYSADQLLYDLENSIPGFLPFGSNLITLIASEEREVVAFIEIQLLKAKNLRLLGNIPWYCESPTMHVMKLNVRIDRHGSSVEPMDCLITMVIRKLFDEKSTNTSTHIQIEPLERDRLDLLEVY